MSDLPESYQVAHSVHHIVRCPPLRLVDDQSAVKWRRLGLAWHAFRPLLGFAFYPKRELTWNNLRSYSAGGAGFFFTSFSNCSIRSTCSCDTSSTKCNSGTRRNCNRSISSRRMYFEPWSSALIASVCSFAVAL